MATDWKITSPKVKTFLNLTLGETYECFEEKTGLTLPGKVMDLSMVHVKLVFPGGSYVILNMQSDVSGCNKRITFSE